MLIYYSETAGRPNIAAESPVNETVENALSIFRALDPRKGFLGVVLTEPFSLQLLPQKGRVRIELLDSSLPAIDSSEADNATAEQLIRAAAKGQDVFQFARQLIADWECLKLN